MRSVHFRTALAPDEAYRVRYGTDDQPMRLPKLSQETLAAMVGTTRSRINLFMNKFRDLGFLDTTVN